MNDDGSEVIKKWSNEIKKNLFGRRVYSEDAYQEACIRVWKEWVKGVELNPRYINVLSYNAAADWLRSTKGRDYRPEFDSVDAYGEDDLNRLVGAYDEDYLLSAILGEMKWSNNTYEIFEDFYLNDLTEDEVAIKHKITKGTLRSYTEMIKRNVLDYLNFKPERLKREVFMIKHLRSWRNV